MEGTSSNEQDVTGSWVSDWLAFVACVRDGCNACRKTRVAETASIGRNGSIRLEGNVTVRDADVVRTTRRNGDGVDRRIWDIPIVPSLDEESARYPTIHLPCLLCERRGSVVGS